MSRTTRALFSHLPYRRAAKLAADLLASQGIGAGSDLQSSGEANVLNLVTGPAPTLIDVGGFGGEYAAMFLDRFPAGRAFVFEPSPSHFARVEQRLARRNARCFQTALGATTGSTMLYKDEEISGLASLTRRDLRHVGIEMNISEMVPITTLDAALADQDISTIDLLKIDVEGHEFDVLSGARDLLAAKRISVIQFEFGGANLDTRTNFRDFWKLLTERGYALSIIGPRRVQPLTSYNEGLEQYRATNYLAQLT